MGRTSHSAPPAASSRLPAGQLSTPTSSDHLQHKAGWISIAGHCWPEEGQSGTRTAGTAQLQQSGEEGQSQSGGGACDHWALVRCLLAGRAAPPWSSGLKACSRDKRDIIGVGGDQPVSHAACAQHAARTWHPLCPSTLVAPCYPASPACILATRRHVDAPMPVAPPSAPPVDIKVR